MFSEQIQDTLSKRSQADEADAYLQQTDAYTHSAKLTGSTGFGREVWSGVEDAEETAE